MRYLVLTVALFATSFHITNAINCYICSGIKCIDPYTKPIEHLKECASSIFNSCVTYYTMGETYRFCATEYCKNQSYVNSLCNGTASYCLYREECCQGDGCNAKTVIDIIKNGAQSQVILYTYIWLLTFFTVIVL